MSHKNNRFDSNKFKSSDDRRFERSRNTREEKKVKEDLPKMVFSFKDFDIKQIPPGQSYDKWQKDELLAYMLQKLGHICGLNIVEAQQQKVLKIYGDFPAKTDFIAPQNITDVVSWAVIMDIKGQKGRVAGHIIDNIFYVVFLDQEHRFYITEKRNT
jgi:hypothetical protein